MKVQISISDGIVLLTIASSVMLGILTSRHLIMKRIKPIFEFLFIGLLCTVIISYFFIERNIIVITYKELILGYLGAFSFQVLYHFIGPVPLFQKIFNAVTGVKIEWKDTENNSKKDL